MSKVTAPLLSFGAAGQIAKTQVYASWKGRPYVRRYVVPANPQSNDQTETRNVFSFLNNVWKFMPAGAMAAWDEYATNNRFTNRNGFIKQNLSNLREQSNLDLMVGSPAVNGGLIASAISTTAGSGQITVSLTAPTLPSGWTIVQANAIAIRDQDPSTGNLYTVTYASDASDPYTGMVLTGLTAGQVYQVFGWFTYQVSETKRAYGLAIRDEETPS